MVFTGSLFVMLILSVIWGRDQRTDPVSVEADYGFPLIWGTQRCVTENYSRSRVFALLITERPTAEPVNETAAGVELEELARYLVVGAVQELWRVNRFYLLLDLVFWIGLMTITATFPRSVRKRTS